MRRTSDDEKRTEVDDRSGAAPGVPEPSSGSNEKEPSETASDADAASHASEPASRPAGRTPGRFRGWRGWVLRVSLFLVSPVLFFGLLEAGLRLAGYGYPTGFFIRADRAGAYRTNDRFGWRFFPPSLARQPRSCLLSAKPANSIRIFVLGGSAAMGYPDPSFSVGRILAVMLRERYPGTQFEVVNAAMTSINSHVSLEIARHCAAHEPDLFVVFMGNNEVIGPYGPGTVFQQWSPNLSLVRASLWAKSSRVGQLLGDVGSRFGSHEDDLGPWRGMEMFLDNPVAADDPRLAAVYDNYRRNLTDICGIARRARAPLILSTVPVNLRDCPPFASLHRSTLTAEERAKWTPLYEAGGALEAAGRWQEAIERYAAAANIDDRFAELHFRLARCLLHAGRPEEARDRFALARDLDVLRFRADSRINAVIREVAAEQQSAGVRFVDAERAFAEHDPAATGIPGKELFYEHVHLMFEGNYVLARSILNQVGAALPQLTAHGSPGTVPSRQRCVELLGLTPWAEYTLVARMVETTSREPFTNQLDHHVRQAAAVRRRDELRSLAATPQAIEASWRIYQSALAEAPDDWCLHDSFGVLAMQSGRHELAVEHLRTAVARMPYRASLHTNLGAALDALGQADEAIAHYRTALEMDPDEAMAHFNLANTLARRGQNEDAIAHYRTALKLQPHNAMIHYGLGSMLAVGRQTDEAIAHYRAALELEPDNLLVRCGLGGLLAAHGRVEEALDHYRAAVKLQPTNPVLLNDTAWLLATAPQATARNGSEAVELARRAMELAGGEPPELLRTLAAAYAKAGQTAEALKAARKGADLARRQNKPALAESFETLVRRYEDQSDL